MFGISSLSLKVIGAAIGALFIGLWAYLTGKNSSTKDELEASQKQNADNIQAMNESASASAEANNQSITAATTAKDAIDAQAQADNAALGDGTDDGSLHDGTDTIAAAITRANSGV